MLPNTHNPPPLQIQTKITFSSNLDRVRSASAAIMEEATPMETDKLQGRDQQQQQQHAVPTAAPAAATHSGYELPWVRVLCAVSRVPHATPCLPA